MELLNGYKMTTTFPMDFTIADKFGESAIEDTFNRAFNEWKTNYVYLTELVVTLNLKLWEHYSKSNMIFAGLYDRLWKKADAFACENLKDKELAFFLRVTD